MRKTLLALLCLLFTAQAANAQAFFQPTGIDGVNRATVTNPAPTQYSAALQTITATPTAATVTGAAAGMKAAINAATAQIAALGISSADNTAGVLTITYNASYSVVLATSTNGSTTLTVSNTAVNTQTITVTGTVSTSDTITLKFFPIQLINVQNASSITVGNVGVYGTDMATGNSATNPILSRLTNGTNVISATAPLATQLSIGNLAVDSTHPVPVSATTSANSATNGVFAELTNGTTAVTGASSALPTTTNGINGTAIASVTNGVPIEVVTSTKRTYRAVAAAFTPYATPTDIITIPGNGTTTVKVKKVIITTTQTTAGLNEFFLVKRSVADTGGTSSSLTVVPLDSSNSAANSTPKKWTVIPTPGAAVGNVADQHCVAPVPAGTTSAKTVLYDASAYDAQPITLRGTAQELAINFNGAAVPTGLSMAVEIEYTEE